MDATSHHEKLFQGLIYFFAFLLLCEWLRPIAIFTDTGNIAVFILFTAVCFFLSMLPVKWWMAMSLKLFGMLVVLDGLFISEFIFSVDWFQTFFTHIQYNVLVISRQEWLLMTPLFRSLLFLVLLWLISYLLYYWFIVAKKVFIFILLTFVYLAVVDTFTNYQADAAIVRTFVISLLAMGAVTLQREIGNESWMSGGLKKLSIWLLPLLAVTFFTAAAGFAAPKLPPQWPDPVPYLTSLNTNAGAGSGAGGGTVQRVGYGVDDSRLGGSFINDTTPVFQAISPERQYWRIETRDVYTGKGWENSSDVEFELQENGFIDLETFHANVETEAAEAYVSFEPDSYFSKAVYPYGVQRIQSGGRVNYRLDETTDAILIEAVGNDRAAYSYQVSYEAPSFPIDLLERENQNDPEEIEDQYLQLPDSLPERVGDLAEQVTAESENRYEAAKAIEQYFNQNGFAYQTQDVAIPDEDEDYVDQFLFETKRGYCDNYSTSMVVMLRSLDIPARWVKGFTGGEIMIDKEAPEGLDFYQISNSNAHSWVEVYFPEVGWVPFEPTQGFTNPADFYMDLSNTQADQPSAAEEQTSEPEEEAEETEAAETEQEDAALATSSDDNGNGSFWMWLLGAAGLGGIVACLYFFRYRLLSSYFVKKYKKSSHPATYQNAYHYLLKLLEQKGIKRAEGQTLREYAALVDRKFGSDDMSRLTYHYERILYRNEDNSDQWGKMTELWENLIKRSLS